MSKPVTFEGFSGGSGLPLKPQLHGVACTIVAPKARMVETV